MGAGVWRKWFPQTEKVGRNGLGNISKGVNDA